MIELRSVLNGEVLMKAEKPFCDLWTTEKTVIPEIRKASNMPETSCPVPKGNYTITNYVIDQTKFELPPGSYIAYFLLTDENQDTLIEMELTATINAL